MIGWNLALREMRRHPIRALLTLLSVVIGVAAVVAVGLSTRSARSAYEEMQEAVAGRAALVIVSAGAGGLDDSLLETVRQSPGVRAAIPTLKRPAIMYLSDRRVKLVVMGIDPAMEAEIRDYAVTEGAMFSSDKEVVLDSSFARGLGVQVGDVVKLLTRSGLVTVQISGLVAPQTGSAVTHGGVLFMPLATAQRRFRSTGLIDEIQLVLNDDADEESVRASVGERLPAGVLVRSPSTRSALADETMMALDNGLRMAITFTLLAAVFIIMNTFLMNVGQRRKQLATLRAIGATRWQVSGLLYREAILMAGVGTALGLLAGWGGASVLIRAMDQLMQTALPEVRLTPMPFALGIIFGFGISLIGASLPARRAAKVSPVEGMSGVPLADAEGGSRKTIIAGIIVEIVVAILFTLCMTGRLPINYSVPTMVLSLIGAVCLLPAVLRPMTYVGAFALRPLLGVEARLARRQLLRHRGRTSLTVGVLFVAVSTGIGLASSVVDNVEDVRNWYRSVILGDFFVRAMMPDMETGLSAAMPDDVGDELQAIPGITQIDTLRFVSATAQGEQVIVIAAGNLLRAKSEQEDLLAHTFAPPGERVTIGSVLSQRTGLKDGDQLVLETQEGPISLTIDAVSNDYMAGGLTVHMRRALAERLLSVQGVDTFLISADHDRLTEVRDELRKLCDRQGLLLQAYTDITSLIETMMSGVVGSLWALLVLGLVVAAFGVVNTLGMNVLEQTRELGLLRVVAMTRRQVRRVILAQAALLGLLGVVPAVAAGLLAAFLINISTMPVTGHPVEFVLRPMLIGSALVVSLAIVIAAAWLPAVRASRLKLADALRYQ